MVAVFRSPPKICAPKIAPRTALDKMFDPPDAWRTALEGAPARDSRNTISDNDCEGGIKIFTGRVPIDDGR